MADIDIVTLPKMRVASFRALGPSPEMEAIGKMQRWAKLRGYIDDSGKYPVWGFNNPCPEHGKKEYGYEVWVKVDEQVQDDDVEFLDIPEREYAHLYSEGFENIGKNWMKLMDWLKSSREFECAEGQCLEGHVFGSTEDDFFALDLYEPVRKKN